MKAWCPGTQAYISATRPKDSLTLFLVVWRRWDLQRDPSLPARTNKWRCSCEYVKGRPEVPTAVGCNRALHPTWRRKRVSAGLAGTHLTSQRIQTWVVCPTRGYRGSSIHFQSLLQPVSEALSARELQRVGRVSLFVSLPTCHRCGMSVRWSWRSTAGRYTASKIAESSCIPSIVTYSLPTFL